MKKWMILALAAALCLAIWFCCLWIDARNSHEDLEYMCWASAAMCVTELRDYEQSGGEDSYLKAACEFRSFMNAYGWLTEGEGKTDHYAVCGRVYGCLLYDWEESQAQIDLLLEGIKLLSENIYDENGFLRLSEFANAVGHAGQ